MSGKLVSTKEQDFLDQDPPLRGQKYVCLSFISPEDVIKKKEVFFFEHFIQDFVGAMNEFFVKLGEKYPDDKLTLESIKERYACVFSKDSIVDEYNYFVNNHTSNLEDEYFEKNDFQTTIRGIKVRGVFDTLKEAEVRAQVLKRIDDKFNVYVAEVGCWCPWSPNPDEIQNQEYAESHLNTLMKNYKENQEKRDYFYQERKRELQFANTKSTIEKDDPWISAKVRDSEAEGSNTVEVVEIPQDSTEASTSGSNTV